ncbi:MAG: glycosyltransferase, partial [Endozoicomonas sp.]
MNIFVITLLIISLALVLYHHLVYPIILSMINVSRYSLPHYFHRHYLPSEKDDQLPTFHIIVPALNESAYIKEKIINLSCIDYPEEKINITIICDGSIDDTADQAEKALIEKECHHLNAEIVRLPKNIGKVSVINYFVPRCHSDIIVLTDVSAIVSKDCLLITASYFTKMKKAGAVCGSYQFIPSESTGEQVYWNYQRKIKIQESALGSTIGMHGAFYAFRKKLFTPLPKDTINDDFSISADIIMQGEQCLYDPRLITIETEKSSKNMNFKRRQRLSTGNVQQAIRYMGLLHPKFGSISFNFFSGKFLRAFMPILTFLILFSSLYLSFYHPAFFLIF